VGFAYVNLGHEVNLEAFTITESPFKRLELGYGWDRLGLGDLPQVLGIPADEVQLHNFNARFQILKEGEFDQKWIPALTAGVHYKYNDGISEVNREVGGALANVAHIPNHDGVDYTLYARNCSHNCRDRCCSNLADARLRASGKAWAGSPTITTSFLKATWWCLSPAISRWRRNTNNNRATTRRLANVVRKEGDWWTIDAAYVVNNHLTLAAGYGHFGNVLNHAANGVWGITTKWEF